MQHPFKYMRKYGMYQEKMELYRDFVCDLVNEVHKTFLGEVMGEKEYREHFDWCWGKTIEKFEEDKIYFDRECELKEYLWGSFYELFYNSDHEIDELKDNLMIMWNFIFDHSRMNKTEVEVKYAVSAYNKFDECLNN